MAKDVTLRITDTLQFIQNTNLVTPGERQPAHQLAQAFINNHYPPGQAGQQGYINFSNKMSLGYHLANDPNERRKMCRAIFLLWTAMHQKSNLFNVPVQDAGQINQGTADRLLKSVIRKARVMQESPGSTAGLNHVLTQVIPNDPVGFLQDNKMIVHGSGVRDHPAQGFQNILGCQMVYDPNHDRYEIKVRQGPIAGALAFQGESVTAMHWTKAAAGPGPHAIGTAVLNNIMAVELSGAHMMVTTQFTGCSFCLKDGGAHVYCAHVSPVTRLPGDIPDTDGPTLAARVMATVAFTNAVGGNPIRVYGRTLGSPPFATGYNLPQAGYMTIIGLPFGGGYRIYSQVTQNDSIASAQQIFP